MSALATAVVCAAFDAATDRVVLTGREVVGRTGVRLATRPRHRPHITLAAVRVHVEQIPPFLERLRPLATATAPITVTLDRVGTFGRAGALWLGPADCPELCMLQRSVHAVVEAGPWPNPFGARTDPREWVPHCSLATRLDPVALERARLAVALGFVPLAAAVTGLAVVLVGGSGDVGYLPLTGPQPSSSTTQNG